jgi:riboflavin biosynthesis pyrimidine reductase
VKDLDMAENRMLPELARPVTAFTPLIDDDWRTGLELAEPFAQVLGSRWVIPDRADRPYVMMGFVVSRDGRISFATPGHAGGGDVSMFNANDQWALALMRARADVVLVGDGTLRAEPEHLWTHQFMWSAEVESFQELRRHEGRDPMPVTAFLSLEGDLPPDAAVFAQAGTRVLILTTQAGSALALERTQGAAADVDVRVFGERSVDIPEALAALHSDGHRSVSCEGGPRAYGSFLAAKCVDDEILTLSPLVIGSSEASPRPSVVEGMAFPYDDAPMSTLVSLTRADNHLFLRSAYIA